MTGNRDRSSTVEILLLLVILAAGFAVRVYDLKDPPLDFHATRQLRSAILSRAFYYQDASNADLSLVSQSKTLAQLETYEPPIMEWLVSRVNNDWTGCFLDRAHFQRIFLVAGRALPVSHRTKTGIGMERPD